LVEADLASLGMAPDAIASLPLCAAAATLGSSPAKALGTAYVLEGSTLGGQVINRALAGASWAPPGGLRYFTPYGENTGAMWRETLETLANASPDSDLEIISGAVETFELLHKWFTRDLGI
jgi:heme oxygenase